MDDVRGTGGVSAMELPARTYRITRADLVRYAGASGDFNPIHWSDRVATSVGLPVGGVATPQGVVGVLVAEGPPNRGVGGRRPAPPGAAESRGGVPAEPR